MKFLIVCGPHSGRIELDCSLFSGVDFGIHVSKPFQRHVNGCYVLASEAPKNMEQANRDSVLWDGAPIVGEIAFSPLIPIADAEQKMRDYLAALKNGCEPNQYSGVFGCALVAANGDCTLACDPLSQYGIFYISNGHSFLFSNSLHLLERACTLLKVNVSRDFTSNAFEIAFGLGGWDRTGLSGVRKIPANHYVQHDRMGTRFVAFDGPLTSSQHEKKPYQERLGDAVISMQRSARALSNALPDQGLVLDLSGGKDTRVVLGATLSEKVANFHVFMGGAPDGPDHTAASRVAHYYGLDSVFYPSNVAWGDDISAIDCARRAAYRFMGTANQYQSELGRDRLAAVARVRGGCSSSRIRSFFPAFSKKRRHKLLKRASQLSDTSWMQKCWTQILSRVEGLPGQTMAAGVVVNGGKARSLFSTAFMEKAYSDIVQHAEWMLNAGVKKRDLSEAYYMFDRSWRHAGFATQVMNDGCTTFEPLNNIWLVKAHLGLSPEARQSMTVAYDLMNAFQIEGLLELPFANGTWPDQFFSGAEREKHEALKQAARATMPPRPITSRRGRAQSIHVCGGPNYMSLVQPYMLELVSSISQNHHCWDFLHRKELLDSLISGVFTAPNMVQTGVRLLHAFIWMMGEESRVPLTEELTSAFPQQPLGHRKP